MTRTELADLPEPKYLLYPNQWIYRGLMAVPVIAFIIFLIWFVPVLLEGETNLWHWVFLGFLGLMTIGVLLPKSRDWRSLITFAATPDGAWFVTDSGDNCVFLPWDQIRDVYEGTVRGRGHSVKGVIFEIDVDRETRDLLNANTLSLFDTEPGPGNLRKIGLSANLRKPGNIINQVERFRNMERSSD